MFELFAAACRHAGVQAQLVSRPCSEAGEVLSALLPFGRAALIVDEAVPAETAERVRTSLKSYRPSCAIVGAGDGFTGLFSLPDDIRAAVGVGPRGIAAARFFATLRGAFSLLIPTDTAAESLFAEAAPPPWQGYPLAVPDAVLADGALLAEAPSLALFAGLCAEEAYIDGVFRGSAAEAEELRAIADAAADTRSAEEKLALSAAFALECRRFAPFACLAAARLCPQEALPAFAAYCARRTRYLFAGAEIRPFFVADYPARILRAAEESGVSARRIAQNVHIPRGAESFALAEQFLQVRARLAASAELLCRGAAPQGDARLFSHLYDLSAELSPRISPAVLEREFGLLPNPPLPAPERAESYI